MTRTRKIDGVRSLLSHPALQCAPKSRPVYQLNQLNRVNNPYLSMLATPLRWCAVSKYKYPSALLLRFRVVQGVLQLRDKASTNNSNSLGKGMSVLCRRSALECMLNDKLWMRLSRNASVPSHFVHAVQSQLVDGVVAELDGILRKLRSTCVEPDQSFQSDHPAWLMQRQTIATTNTTLFVGFYITLASTPTHTVPFSRLTQGTYSSPIYTFSDKYADKHQLNAIRYRLSKLEEQLRRRGCNTGQNTSDTFAFGFGRVSDAHLSIDLTPLAVALWRCRMWHEDELVLEGFGLNSGDIRVIR
ncbi:hypothetical protein E3P78_03027 [Wallemia ichthyophaga]|nr:hypothetical protein E3P78_03027 [Wallemia ichthyophaga]